MRGALAVIGAHRDLRHFTLKTIGEAYEVTMTGTANGKPIVDVGG
ncbi:MAG: hypothetical protein JWL84_1809 [Rhodospirillales bacterium]|jgi:hypothetical protein|nr:hypothetical protein [Rhodospirillales bacterium]